MKKCTACGIEEEVYFKLKKSLFINAFGFCPTCSQKFLPLLRILGEMFKEGIKLGNALEIKLKILGNKKKVIPGKCRFCGCVETKACAGRCSWANKEKTICTACV